MCIEAVWFWLDLVEAKRFFVRIGISSDVSDPYFKSESSPERPSTELFRIFVHSTIRTAAADFDDRFKVSEFLFEAWGGTTTGGVGYEPALVPKACIGASFSISTSVLVSGDLRKLTQHP